MLQAGEVIGDTYRLERQLGQGGMGEVWLARHLLLDEYRAIKIVLGEIAENPALRDRFIRGEARNSLRLERHHNIVRIYELGQHRGMPYMVMEYVEGRNLRQLLSQRKTFSPSDVGIMLKQLAEALDVAHRQGMVHRDIKPANVMVDMQGVLKLGDFGLTKNLEASASDGLTTTGEYLGTPAYTSPEQLNGQADRRSDIYSLGAMVYELLTGRPPFTGVPAQVIVQHVTTPPAPLRSLNPQIPPAVEQVVLKALAKPPAERYQSALEFSRAYQQALRGEGLLVEAGAGTLPLGSGQPPVGSYRPDAPARTPAPPSSAFGGVPQAYTASGQTPTQLTTSGNRAFMLTAIALIGLIVVMGLAIVLLLFQNNNNKSISVIIPTQPAASAATPPGNVATTAAPPPTTAVAAATTASATTAVPVTTAPPTTALPPTTSAPDVTVPVAATTTAAPPVPITKRGKLLYTFSQNNSPNTGLKKFSLSTGREDLVAPLDTNAGQTAWTNDGNGFVFVNQTDRSINLVVGTSSQKLTTGLNPSFSPDGKKLVYVLADQIVVANADGSSPVQLTTSNGPKLGPKFSPDGSKIAYAYKAENNLWQIWVMDANGANQTQLTQSADNARFPVWSPSGQQLAYNTALPDATTPKDIWVIDSNGANARAVVTGGQNGRPFWVEDYIFFNSDKDKPAGHSDIWAVHSDGSGRVRITNSGADLDYYNPVWSADN